MGLCCLAGGSGLGSRSTCRMLGISGALEGFGWGVVGSGPM